MIVAPKFPDELVHSIFFVMQAYLTNGWRLSFTHAAGIMNFWEGMSLVLASFFQFLADTLLGNFIVAVISTISSSVGIGMVALSVPHILDHSGGRCRKPGAESCLNDTQIGVFYTGMVLTALGRAGISFSLDALHDEQSTPHSSNCLREAINKCTEWAVWADKFFLRLIGSLLVMIWIKKWKLLFGIPAIYSGYMTLWFLCGICLYKSLSPQGSPINRVCRVLRHSSKKKSQPSIQNGEEIAEHQNRTSFSKEEDETTRFVVKMIPISITFILSGIVSSIGNTYFVEQANHMNRRVGSWKVPLLALQLPVILFKMNQDLYLYCFFKIDKDWLFKHFKMDLPIAGIGSAMLYSVLCCITAARMETKRLEVVRRYDMLHKPDDEEVPMHAAWLLFQFFLLAGLDSFLRKSVEEFYKDQAPQHLKAKLKNDENTKRYLKSAVDFVCGLGFWAGVLSVYVVGKLSEIGGKPNWFQYTLNMSRLDRYYWVLAGLSAVNLVVFNLVAARGYRRRPSSEGSTAPH
ncbi:hypothetical protein C2S51_014575 [Perilla frutescens var. frutescens]|nr:hypothetical protein C2S51_014575 [Perilla frutescens var. frutescens]